MSKCVVKYKGNDYNVAWIDFKEEQVSIEYNNRRIVVTPNELDSVVDLFLSVPLRKKGED